MTTPAAVSNDREVITRQLGRPPRGSWTVAARCRHGAPVVIAVAPVLEHGTPFPTTYWLTCPRLAEDVGSRESDGESARWASALISDLRLAAAAQLADSAYRIARSVLADGTDPCATVGIAGQADPLAVKCLHARVAAAIAGISDPVGRGVLAAIAGDRGLECDDDRCAAKADADAAASA